MKKWIIYGVFFVKGKPRISHTLPFRQILKILQKGTGRKEVKGEGREEVEGEGGRKEGLKGEEVEVVTPVVKGRGKVVHAKDCSDDWKLSIFFSLKFKYINFFDMHIHG